MARTQLTEAQVIEGLAAYPQWHANGLASIGRDFTFEDHIAALGFVVQVATIAETLDHHPEIHWIYNKVQLTLSTHDVGGITRRDFDLASRIDNLPLIADR